MKWCPVSMCDLNVSLVNSVRPSFAAGTSCFFSSVFFSYEIYFHTVITSSLSHISKGLLRAICRAVSHIRSHFFFCEIVNLFQVVDNIIRNVYIVERFSLNFKSLNMKNVNKENFANVVWYGETIFLSYANLLNSMDAIQVALVKWPIYVQENWWVKQSERVIKQDEITRDCCILYNATYQYFNEKPFLHIINTINMRCTDVSTQ